MLKVRNSGVLRTIPLLITIFSLSFPAYAKYSGGTGEPNDPYQITTAEDLLMLGDSPEDYDKHFILIEEIDMDPNLPGRKVFDGAVIASDTDHSEGGFQGTKFSGTFEGNGFVIRNLYIKGIAYLGLFGSLTSEANISNLGLEYIDVNGPGECIGGLVGDNNGSVTNNYSTGTVSGSGLYVGGLVGLNSSGSIVNSYSTGTVHGRTSIGGLVGLNLGDIAMSYSIGMVNGSGSYVGGLVGRSHSGSIFNSYSTCIVSSKGSAGGLVGYNEGSITESYSSGIVHGMTSVGGLVGLNIGDIAMSYSIGMINGYGFHVGGLVGRNYSGSISSSFWDTHTSGLTKSAGGTGLSTPQMVYINTYLEHDWDFNDTWAIWEGHDYPHFQWEPGNLPTFGKVVNEVDLYVHAQGFPVQITRTYYLDSRFDGPLGFGWTHTYLIQILEMGDGFVKIFDSNGSASFFRPNGDGTYDSSTGDFRVLTKNPDQTYQLREKSGKLYLFNTAGKLVGIEDRNGNVMSLSYGDNDLLKTITDASSKKSDFAYDPNNKLSSITDPAGRTVSYGYDYTGNLTSVTDFGGFVTRYAYDENHNLTKITDPAGRQTFFTVDVDDRLESVTNPGCDCTKTFEYGVPTANQITVTDVLGNQTISTYNNKGLLTEVTDPLGNTTSMTYDTDLNLTSRTDAVGNQTVFTYDTKGNVLTSIDAQGNTVAITYESLFNQITNIVDENGNTTSFEYDGKGNLIIRRYPNGKIETSSYDERGNLSSLTDSNGNTTTFEYNTNGKLTAMIYPDGTSEVFDYDISGNLVSKTDRMGQTINHINDLLGRLITKSYPDNTLDTFTYDEAGKLLSVEDENGIISFEYNDSGQIAKVTYPAGDVVSYGYDAAGNRNQLTYPNGMVLDYTYDSLKRLTKINESEQMVAAYAYDQISRKIRRELRNGTYTTYSYDPSNRLLELINRKSTSEVISSFAYTYDSAGNRLTMTTLDGLTQYTYDAIHQLTNVIYPDDSTTSYNLDPAGNRVSEVIDGTAKEYISNDLNQYTAVNEDSYTYDGNGNMTSMITPSGATVYTYDFDNRLIEVDTVTETIIYTYDPFGRRTSKRTSSGTTSYIHDGLRVIMEKGDSDTIEATYIHGIGIDEVLVMNRGGTDYYYSQDGLGSVADLTDFSENIIESFSYDAYGTPSNQSSVGNPYLFTGREFEPETSMYFYRARYYNPAIGRFISTDPIGLAGGNNLYTYVANNPINLVDPAGLASKPPDWGARCSILRMQCVIVCRLDEWNIGWCQACQKKLEELCGGNNGGDLSSGDPTFIQMPKKERIHYQPISNSKNLVAKIAVPHEASLVRANVPIFGKAFGKDFKEYRVEYGAGENPSEWVKINASTQPQTKDITSQDIDDSLDLTIYGNLATWDTGLKNYVYPLTHPKDHPINLKGTYTIRLVVTGNDDSTVEDRVTVDVANVIPNAWGGQVTSKNGRVVLTVPEQALLDSFRLILIEAEKKKQLASPLERQTIGNIYRVREPGEQFTKEALLQMAYDKEEFGDISPNQIGIYGYNLRTKEWEYIASTRDEQRHFVFARVRKLHAYYTLMASKTAGEGSAEISESQKTAHNQQTYTIPAHGQTLVSNTFEDGLGQWSNRDNEVGATIILNSSVTNDGSLAAKIVNTHVGGNFAVNVINTPFDVRTYPIVQFDYRLPAGVKTNFLVKVSGRWYEIGFTDDAKVLWDKRVNIGHIGDIQGVKRDGQWHTVQFNLYEMLRTKTRHTVVDEMIMADWDVTGYMKLVYGQNKKGSTYYIDNFTIRKDTSAGTQIDQDVLVLDDFNKRKAQNALGGNSLLFYSSDTSQIEKQFALEERSKQGYSLKLKYKLNGKLGYVGYLSNLLNLDLWQYQVLSIKLKADKSSANQDFVLGIKDRAGNQCKIQIGSFVSGGITDEWKTAVIPLVAFEGIKDWGHIENISLSFEGRLSQDGTIYVDDIEFQKHVQTLLVDDFERLDRKNRLLREHRTFAGGVAAINGQHAKASVNTVYRLSYGGIIGVGNIHDKNMKSFSGWVTYLGGIDCSNCDALSFKIRGFEGNENFTVYLNDGTFQWGITVGNKAAITIEWQEVVIPLKEYSEYGIDLSNITEIRFGFEGEKTSGAIDLDDIQFTTIND